MAILVDASPFSSLSAELVGWVSISPEWRLRTPMLRWGLIVRYYTLPAAPSSLGSKSSRILRARGFIDSVG